MDVLSLTSLPEFLKDLKYYVGYLEKASMSNLGDFTPAGKTVNAGYGNYTIYWKWYNELTGQNWQGEPYCAGAVSTVLSRAFGYDKAKKLLGGSLLIGCPDIYDSFSSRNRVYSVAKPGDIVLFWSKSKNRWAHTGIVTSVHSGGFNTFEANTSSGNNTVIRNGGATCFKSYTYGAVKAVFCRPDYASVGISLDGAKLEAPAKLTTYDVRTGVAGLISETVVNLRDYPVTGKVIGTINDGEAFFPIAKAFIDGQPWLKDGDGRWMSAMYCHGWIQELSDNNQWWYVTKGYKYVTDAVKVIDDKPYYFNSNGYMHTGEVTIITDDNGVLKSSS